MIFTAFFDYLMGLLIEKWHGKLWSKIAVTLSVIVNLSLLISYKYGGFIWDNLHQLFGYLPFDRPMNSLPIGISFYTFHGMSYVFDIYRNKQKPVANFVDYAVFVSFFPLLVAGPIERANHLLPQVQKRRLFNYPQAVEGCRLILWGMFKKVVIADSIALTVNDIFENYTNFNGATLVVGAIAFSIQIYGDFSGYSDIAIGSAKLFGFELLSNFKFPYFSRDIAEFWRRWHVSLSSWFRDYLYIPLGGSKKGKLVAIRNTFIIFLVSGFWHGASWNFIVWGAVHACGFLPLLILNRNRKFIADVVAHDKIFPTYKELWQMISTFLFVSFAWIFFRVDEVQKAWLFIKRIMLNIYESPIENITSVQGINTFLYIVPLVSLDWYFRRNERFLRTPKFKFLRYLIYIVMSMIILKNLDLFSDHEKIEFIYFQF
jgi:hypothetical protein